MKQLSIILALSLCLIASAAMSAGASANRGTSGHNHWTRVAANQNAYDAGQATNNSPNDLCGNTEALALAGKPTIRVRASASDPSCLQRTYVIQARLTNLLSHPVRKDQINAQYQNGEWGVYAANKLIATADTYSAQMNGTTPRVLAEVWAANLRSTIPQALPWAYSPAAQRYQANTAQAVTTHHRYYSRHVASRAHYRTHAHTVSAHLYR